MKTDGTLKPGYTTTEFWLTLLTNVVAVVLVMQTVVWHRTIVDQSTLNALIPCAAAIAAVIGNAFYTVSRSQLKAAHMDVVATTAVANATAKPVETSAGATT